MSGAYAHAGNSDGGSGKPAIAAQDKTSEQIQAMEKLIQELYDAGAIVVDQDGKIHVEKSVVEELKEQGRWSVQMASNGSICH